VKLTFWLWLWLWWFIVAKDVVFGEIVCVYVCVVSGVLLRGSSRNREWVGGALTNSPDHKFSPPNSTSVQFDFEKIGISRSSGTRSSLVGGDRGMGRLVEQTMAMSRMSMAQPSFDPSSMARNQIGSSTGHLMARRPDRVDLLSSPMKPLLLNTLECGTIGGQRCKGFSF
jgi:hypothetical protein